MVVCTRRKTRERNGVGVGRYRAGRCGAQKAQHHFSETKENRQKNPPGTSEGEKLWLPQSGISWTSPFYPAIRYIFFLLASLFVFLYIPLSMELNFRIWTYYPRCHHVSLFLICSHDTFNALVLFQLFFSA